MGRIEAICVSAMKGEKKTPQLSARFVAGHGIEGDAHAGPWHRQVSLLAVEDIEGMRQRGLPDLKPGDFGENIVASGVDLRALGLGSRLRLGGNTDMKVTQLGKVCHQRCAIYYQTGDCIMPRLGLFARVVRDGTVATGDAVEVLEVVPRKSLQAVILTIHDRCSPGETNGRPAATLKRLLETLLSAHVYASEVVPDDRERVAARLRHYSYGHSIDLVLVVGGGGSVARNMTPGTGWSALRLTASLSEAEPETRFAVTRIDDRSVIRNGAFILDLPGSERDAATGLLAALPALQSLPTRGGAAA